MSSTMDVMGPIGAEMSASVASMMDVMGPIGAEMSASVASMMDVMGPIGAEMSASVASMMDVMGPISAEISHALVPVIAEIGSLFPDDWARTQQLIGAGFDALSLNLGMAGSLGLVAGAGQVRPKASSHRDRFDEIIQNGWLGESDNSTSCSPPGATSEPTFDVLTLRDSAHRMPIDGAILCSLMLGAAAWTADLLFIGAASPVGAMVVAATFFGFVRRPRARNDE